MRKLTDPQKKLLELLKLYKYVKNSDGVFQYDHMKNICDFKSFDGTFNALLNKGIVQRVYGTGLNTFELSDKCNNYINGIYYTKIPASHVQYYREQCILTAAQYKYLKNKYDL